MKNNENVTMDFLCNKKNLSKEKDRRTYTVSESLEKNNWFANPKMQYFKNFKKKDFSIKIIF